MAPRIAPERPKNQTAFETVCFPSRLSIWPVRLDGTIHFADGECELIHQPTVRLPRDLGYEFSFVEGDVGRFPSAVTMVGPVQFAFSQQDVVHVDTELCKFSFSD